MLLYLVQHAEAKQEEEDPSRGLTDKGFRDISLTALFARDQGVAVSRIRHSGKKRAAQTAQVLADKIRPEKGTEQADGLAPMDDPNKWADRLSGMDDDIMLVGHLPSLARLASLLLCGDGGKSVVDFKMAGIVCLKRFGDGHWSVEWIVTPGMVR